MADNKRSRPVPVSGVSVEQLERANPPRSLQWSARLSEAIGTRGILALFTALSVGMSEAVNLLINVFTPLPRETFILSFVIPLIVSPPIGWLSLYVQTAMTDLYKANSALADAYRKLAFQDQLTNTLNRRGLFSHAAQCSADERLMVGLADLDRFKQINDVHGHDVGDYALVEAAAQLRTLAGPHGRVARTGGDEFVVLIPQAEGRPTPQRLTVQLHDGLSLGMSLGWASATAATLDEGMRRADEAMYLIKRPPTFEPALRSTSEATPQVPQARLADASSQ